MSLAIEFYFDFGSPNAYLVYRVLPEITARLGPVVTLKPALLGAVFKATNNRSPFEAFAGIPAKQAYERLQTERFVAQHAITGFRHNPFFPINTLAMMRGAMAARKLDLFAPYVATVYAAMWEQGLNMGEPEIMAQVLADAGLPAQTLMAEIGAPDVKQALINATQELIDRGGFGSPTFFVGTEMFFGKDQLRDVEEEFLRHSRAAEGEPA